MMACVPAKQNTQSPPTHACAADARACLRPERRRPWQISVEDYLKAMHMHPSTEFAARTAFDPIEADHLRAMLVANAREREREIDRLHMMRERLRALNLAAYERANKIYT